MPQIPTVMIRSIQFTKMQAAGNDYIYVYGQDFQAEDASRVAADWCDRHKGIGADGIVLINPSQIADFRMQMFNADGSEGMMCGNAARCIGRYLYSRGYAGGDIALETASGVKELHVNSYEDQIVGISVNMGAPSFSNPSQFLPEKEQDIPEDFRGHFVSMGNPHYVIFVKEVSRVRLEKIGKQLEHASCFPAAANIEFAQFIDDNLIRMRVWERGSGITLACGTGACATAVAAISYFGRGRNQTILMDGGLVRVEWQGGDVLLTGDAEEVYSGKIGIEQ